MPGFLSPRQGMPLLLIPELIRAKFPDRSKTAHRKPPVKCFLTIHWSSRTAKTKCQALGDLSNRNLFSHRSRGWASIHSVSMVSPEAFVCGLAVFSPSPLRIFPSCAGFPGDSSSSYKEISPVSLGFHS